MSRYWKRILTLTFLAFGRRCIKLWRGRPAASLQRSGTVSQSWRLAFSIDRHDFFSAKARLAVFARSLLADALRPSP